MGLGRLFVRVAVGALFVGHGTQKLFGWFGGNGLAATAEGFEKMGMRPGKANALAAGAAEAGGGLLLAAGLATPLAATILTSVMGTAIHKVHWKNGPWAMNGGYEYNLVLVALMIGLVETGPGPLSADYALGIEHAGTGWALGALGAGVAGSVLAHESARRNAVAEPEPAAAS